MGVILDFGKWRKLHEAEEAEMAMDASASGPNPYATGYKGNAKRTLDALKTILAKKDSAAFWKLSNAVGGILKTIGPLSLNQSERSDISYGVSMMLDSAKYKKTIDMYSEWAKSTGWESFLSLFKDEPGKAESWDNDLDRDFRMPPDTGRWNMD